MISFAREKGYFKGKKDSDFSFADAYAPADFSALRFCEARVWSFFNRYVDGMEKYLPYASGENPQAEPMPLFEHGRMPLRGNTIQGVLLRLLHHSTHHFLQHLRIIRNISDEIENKIEFAVTNKSLVNMFSLLKSLTYYESATSANQLLLLKLKNDANKIGFNEEELDFLDDITVENKQCDNLAGIYAGILTGMSDARVSVVSNNLAVIMKYLAVINVVFMPATVMTGLGGMSEFSMITEGLWWPHAYSALVLVMVVVGYITYLLVRQIGTNDNGRRR